MKKTVARRRFLQGALILPMGRVMPSAAAESQARRQQVAAAIARFVKKKVDTGQLVLPAETESPSVGPDPMNLEVEPQASSGKCFRLRLEQKIEGGFT